eukprot:gnl/TRDRNA2_/TRDRNA2_71733_c0_seq1.p2 gnl/TRDRNA2_/TRDRNA2_71733_c0~~gnl/TRDRNA2_/TRDRNA2_71733_c0_seq1.p2  ORF type:complete len:185 (+),score=23.44 gnl/TRDRNA2_/TRDRNA2_71733_c0_seq1:3-557(+)
MTRGFGSRHGLRIARPRVGRRSVLVLLRPPPAMASASSASTAQKRKMTLSDAFKVDDEANDPRNAPPPDAKMSKNFGKQMQQSTSSKTHDAHKAKKHASKSTSTKTGDEDGVPLNPEEAAQALASRQGSPGEGASALASESERATPMAFCWLCKRCFDSSVVLDRHVLHSDLHRQTVRRIAGLA